MIFWYKKLTTHNLKSTSAQEKERVVYQITATHTDSEMYPSLGRLPSTLGKARHLAARVVTAPRAVRGDALTLRQARLQT
jgi:hypothetical protein